MKTISGNKVSAAFYRDWRAAKDSHLSDGSFRIYAVLKGGKLSKTPHKSYNGRSAWSSQEDAQAEATRMMALNPGRTYRVI